MRCEFCQGQGIVRRSAYESSQGYYDEIKPCAECNGHGIADCCNGINAETCRDNEVKR